ncbi:hypothetical protein GCM10008967_07370 [Bacillus carboniphilus]|uniref:Uncharacterized protein n=1 Tax=Bacillus carboniphilus TaxID=86663 RepID=A0ABP3FJD6_9BACI
MHWTESSTDSLEARSVLESIEEDYLDGSISSCELTESVNYGMLHVR